MKSGNFIILVLFVAISEFSGIIGSVFTAPSAIYWYASLAKPELAPPNWIFAPVWMMLFALMGIAAFLVWKEGTDKKAVRIALGMFVCQLILNALWSIIFFGFRNPFGALIEIIFLWFAIILTIVLFFKISRKAAWLLVLYIIWVSFAAYLNFYIWRLN